VACLAGSPLAVKRGAPQASHVVCCARVWVRATHPMMQQLTDLVSKLTLASTKRSMRWGVQYAAAEELN